MMDTPHAEPDAKGLAELEARVRRDREDMCVPAPNWVPETVHDGQRVLDVVIVGGGMCGLAAHHALVSGGIRKLAQFDRSAQGREGPWITYARMETLRSPKHLTGPALGYASLTFRAWYRAQYGEAVWDALGKIDRAMWMDYLVWYREVLGLEVQNEVSVDRIAPEAGLLRLQLSGRNAPAPSVLARKVVLATGRDGLGKPNIPDFMAGVSRAFWAHTADDIDFAALKGKRVVVVGIGASAVDNAAEALEAGATEVRHLIRRQEMPTINKLMGIGSFGFACGYAALSEEWRWRIMRYSFMTQTPAPRNSTLRVSRHVNAYFHFGKAVTKVERRGEGLRVTNADGSALDTDFLILATGFTTDPMDRTELGDDAANVQLWRDVYTPPADERHDELAKFPYLGPDFTFREKEPGLAPWLSNVYCFNHAAALSVGKVSGDIPDISLGATWLAEGIAATLYREDIDRHWQHLQDYAKPELQGDEWAPSPLPAAASDSEAAV